MNLFSCPNCGYTDYLPYDMFPNDSYQCDECGTHCMLWDDWEADINGEQVLVWATFWFGGIPSDPNGNEEANQSPDYGYYIAEPSSD